MDSQYYDHFNEELELKEKSILLAKDPEDDADDYKDEDYDNDMKELDFEEDENIDDEDNFDSED